MKATANLQSAFFKSASVLIISVIWSLMVTSPAASFPHAEPNQASTRVDHERILQASISQVGFLDKRGKGLDLSLVSFEPGELLLPVQAAAEVLEAFYLGIAINSNGPWAKNAPRIWIRITFGAIRLLMTATEGTTIPWDFVTWFAQDMLKLTERGYTGMYTANFVNPTVGNAIWVSLYYCAIGPLTDPAAIRAPGNVAACLNPEAQAWFPMRGKPAP